MSHSVIIPCSLARDRQIPTTTSRPITVYCGPLQCLLFQNYGLTKSSIHMTR
jgi:hypothetical protein